jgi:hypothetical protein
MGLPLQMSSNAQILPIAPATSFSLTPLWHHATLAVHLGVMAAAALCIGLGEVSLEMARWGANVLMDVARSFAE